MSTPNPFDQFDAAAAPTANPFDQFDAAPKAEARAAPDETVGRIAGLGARALASGAADLPGSMTRVAQAMNPIDAMTNPDNPGRKAITNYFTGKQDDASAATPDKYDPQLSDFIHPDKWHDAVNFLADKAGLAKPETPAERIGSKAVEAIPSAVLSPEAPIAGALSSMAGGAASQGAKEAGFGPLGQAAAGLAVGTAPGLAGAGAAATAKGIARGGEGGRQAMLDRIATAKDADLPLSAGQAGGSSFLQYLEGASAKLWGGRPIGKLAEQQTSGAAGNVGRIVENLSQGNTVSPMGAGEAIVKGMGDKKTPGTALGDMHAAEGDAYDKVAELIHPETHVDVSGTLGSVNNVGVQHGVVPVPRQLQTIRKNLLARIEANANRGELNPKPIDGTAPPSTVGDPPASLVAPKVSRGPLGEQIESPPTPTSLLPEDASRPAAWDAPGPDRPITASEAPAFGGMGVNAPKPKPTLSYGDLRALKTDLGNSIDWGFAPSDPVANGKLKTLWGSVQGDLKAAAENHSPEAAAAQTAADKLYQTNSETRESLLPILNTKGGPEAVYRAATNGTKQGATKISQVMGAIGPDHQNLVRATVLDKIGKASGAQDAPFNANTFLTNWDKIDGAAKDAMFGASGTQGSLRHNLDSLTDTIKTIRDGTKLKNFSGSGEAVGHGAGLVAAWEGIKSTLMGHPATLAGAAGGVAANHVLARALTNPKTVAWLAKTTKMPTSGLPNAVNQLRQLSDPDASALADYLSPRPARASGGKVDNMEALVGRLMNRWKAAKRETDASTKPLLKVPDAAIVRALDIAQRSI